MITRVFNIHFWSICNLLFNMSVSVTEICGFDEITYNEYLTESLQTCNCNQEK